jgi:hypothetical protein
MRRAALLLTATMVIPALLAVGMAAEPVNSKNA